MPYSKLIAKESTLRIIVKSLGSTSIGWLLLKNPIKTNNPKILSVWQRWRCEGKSC